jgi:hypothetical protein
MYVEHCGTNLSPVLLFAVHTEVEWDAKVSMFTGT